MSHSRVEEDPTDLGSIIASSADRLFGELGPISNPASRREAEGGTFSPHAWARLEEAAFPLAMLGDEGGGVGVPHALMIARLAGMHALAMPLVETMAANWLLGRAGLAVSKGAVTFTDSAASIERQGSQWRVAGDVADVPWGRAAALACAGTYEDRTLLVCIERAALSVREKANKAGEPRDHVSFDVEVAANAVGTLALTGGESLIHRLGAALRAAQLAGAMQAVVGLTATYVRERQQFGKPLVAFQAVQQMLALMATLAAAARAAADLGAEAIENGMAAAPIAVAKIRTSEAAGIVAGLAHQLHGAMGFTLDYPLQLLTRRLWSWRDECGSDCEWALTLGRVLTPDRGAALWPALTRI